MNPRSYFLLLVGLIFSPSLRAEDEIWTDNKLTTSQPFPAAVRGVLQTWVGYELLLEELGGEGRLCVARVFGNAPLEYRLVEDAAKELAAEPERKKIGWIYVSPAIEVNRFSWCIGPQRIGRIFGDDDILRQITIQPKVSTK